jgi:4-hydroxyphenylpyruvate dioxygenase-like putative hemolysin
MEKCVWVRPEIVARIEFLEWTVSDHLRHAKFAGLREGQGRTHGDPHEWQVCEVAIVVNKKIENKVVNA